MSDDTILLNDSAGWPITKDARYKIRLPGGSELAFYAKDVNSYYRVVAGPPGSGSVFYIDEATWPDRQDMQLRLDGVPWAHQAPINGLYIEFMDWGTYVTLHATGTYSQRQTVFGIRGGNNTVFLGHSKDYGLALKPDSGLQTGWDYVAGDATKAWLEVQFIRMPDA